MEVPSMTILLEGVFTTVRDIDDSASLPASKMAPVFLSERHSGTYQTANGVAAIGKTDLTSMTNCVSRHDSVKRLKAANQ
jgi:hypothetical protein